MRQLCGVATVQPKIYTINALHTVPSAYVQQVALSRLVGGIVSIHTEAALVYVMVSVVITAGFWH